MDETKSDLLLILFIFQQAGFFFREQFSVHQVVVLDLLHYCHSTQHSRALTSVQGAE